jgi:hypothetical protein
VQCITYDWVHTLLQHGVLSVEIEGLMSRCSHLGVSREVLQTFLKDDAWTFPQASAQKQKNLHRIFDVHRVSDKEPDKLRCTCSELLGVYGMLRFRFKTQWCPQLRCNVRDGRLALPVSFSAAHALLSTPAPPTDLVGSAVSPQVKTSPCPF